MIIDYKATSLRSDQTLVTFENSIRNLMFMYGGVLRGNSLHRRVYYQVEKTLKLLMERRNRATGTEPTGFIFTKTLARKGLGDKGVTVYSIKNRYPEDHPHHKHVAKGNRDRDNHHFISVGISDHSVSIAIPNYVDRHDIMMYVSNYNYCRNPLLNDVNIAQFLKRNFASRLTSQLVPKVARPTPEELLDYLYSPRRNIHRIARKAHGLTLTPTMYNEILLTLYHLLVATESTSATKVKPSLVSLGWHPCKVCLRDSLDLDKAYLLSQAVRIYKALISYPESTEYFITQPFKKYEL